MLTARSTNLPEKLPTKAKKSSEIMQENLSDFNKLTMDENWDDSESGRGNQAAEEPILIPNNKRFVLFPIEYNEVRISCLYLCMWLGLRVTNFEPWHYRLD